MNDQNNQPIDPYKGNGGGGGIAGTGGAGRNGNLDGDKALVAKEDNFLRNFKSLKELQENVNEAQLEFIKNTVAPTLNDKETLLFLYRARNLGLDVLNSEFYSYVIEKKAEGNNAPTRQQVFIIAKDGKHRKAIDTGKLEYDDAYPIYIQPDPTDPKKMIKCEPWEGGTLWGAVAIVKRTDRRNERKVVVPLSEYRLSNAIWNSKPQTMIVKVALSQALSLEFPELFSGIYDESESFIEGEYADENTRGRKRKESDSKNESKPTIEAPKEEKQAEPEQPTKAEEPKEVVIPVEPIQNGDSPVSPDQVETIAALGGQVTEGMTKQQAAELIASLVRN